MSKDDVFYDPRGAWRHRSAVKMRSLESEMNATVPPLHRHSTATTRSGVSVDANVPNMPGVPAKLLAERLQAASNMQNGAEPSKRIKPAGITAYTVNNKWDSHFVLAPASAVEAQNALSQLQSELETGRAGPSWSRLHDDHAPGLNTPPLSSVDGSQSWNDIERARQMSAATAIHVTEPLWKRYGRERRTFNEARFQSKWTNVRDRPVNLLPADFVSHMHSEIHQQNAVQSPTIPHPSGDRQADASPPLVSASESGKDSDDAVEHTNVRSVPRPYGKPVARSSTRQFRSKITLNKDSRRKHNLFPHVSVRAKRNTGNLSLAALSSMITQAPKNKKRMDKMLKMPDLFHAYKPPRLARRKPFGSLGIS